MVVPVLNAALAAILEHAARDPGREVCGLLLAEGDRPLAAAPAANVADDPAHAFEIDPAALLAAQRAERQGGPRLCGYYHSHPSGSPLPSPRDAARARADGRLWLIAAGGRVHGFQATAGGPIHGRFAAVTLKAA